jgi:hypothetical protein
MAIRSFWLAGLLVLAALLANAQTYWSTNANLNCGAYGDANGKPLKLDTGAYVCYVYGTLPWYVSGGGWASSIRVSAPPSAPVAYFLSFSDENGVEATLDFLYQGDATVHTGTSASRALYANQPLEVNILGLHGGTAANGPVVVLAECPDATTCSQVQAQVFYSADAAHSWWLSAPVVWDLLTKYEWSSVGVDNGTTDMVTFVIYNIDTVAQTSQTYTLNVYNAAGNLYATATTRAVPLYGSYADLLRNVISNLPSGAFKLQVVGSGHSAFEALQFHGTSATALATAPEVVPAAGVTNSATSRNRNPSPAALRLAPPSVAR